MRKTRRKIHKRKKRCIFTQKILYISSVFYRFSLTYIQCFHDLYEKPIQKSMIQKILYISSVFYRFSLTYIQCFRDLYEKPIQCMKKQYFFFFFRRRDEESLHFSCSVFFFCVFLLCLSEEGEWEDDVGMFLPTKPKTKITKH